MRLRSLFLAAEQVGVRGGIKKMRNYSGELGGLTLLICISAGCSNQSAPDCVMPPCPTPAAILANVTSTTSGGPVPGLTVTWTGSTSGSVECTAFTTRTDCIVPGLAGTYNLQFTAAGFQDTTLTVAVQAAQPPCGGCASVQMEQVTVVMTPK